MFYVRPIESLEMPELAPYRTMRRPAPHVEQRIFVAEGDKVVRRLLESPLSLVSVLLPDKWVQDFEPLLKARREDFPVFVAPKETLEELTGFSMYQGVLAVGRIPESVSLDTILMTSPQPRLLVALDALSNAENLGVIIRNCVAFGVHGLVAGETCSSPYMRRSVRNSMGTIFKLPVLEPPNLVQTLGNLRRFGIRCLAAHGQAKGRTIAQCDFAGDCCLVFGSEGDGLSEAVLAACDEAVAIPMANDVDSLNVGTATAVFLYEVNRQRQRM